MQKPDNNAMGEVTLGDELIFVKKKKTFPKFPDYMSTYIQKSGCEYRDENVDFASAQLYQITGNII